VSSAGGTDEFMFQLSVQVVRGPRKGKIFFVILNKGFILVALINCCCRCWKVLSWLFWWSWCFVFLN